MEHKTGNEFFDYAGNRIVEGMKILLVSLKAPAHTITGRTAKKINGLDTQNEESASIRFPERDENRIIMEYDVVFSDTYKDFLCAKKTFPELSVTIPLHFLFADLPKHHIIEIKGLSEYYRQNENK